VNYLTFAQKSTYFRAIFPLPHISLFFSIPLVLPMGWILKFCFSRGGEEVEAKSDLMRFSNLPSVFLLLLGEAGWWMTLAVQTALEVFWLTEEVCRMWVECCPSIYYPPTWGKNDKEKKGKLPQRPWHSSCWWHTLGKGLWAVSEQVLGQTWF
jgi:hypothetical protein